MKDPRIVVVGAGIAGLTAAYFLKQAGHHPIILEKSDRGGGDRKVGCSESVAIPGLNDRQNASHYPGLH